jgi:hypothetical protein
MKTTDDLNDLKSVLRGQVCTACEVRDGATGAVSAAAGGATRATAGSATGGGMNAGAGADGVDKAAATARAEAALQAGAAGPTAAAAPAAAGAPAGAAACEGDCTLFANLPRLARVAREGELPCGFDVFDKSLPAVAGQSHAPQVGRALTILEAACSTASHAERDGALKGDGSAKGEAAGKGEGPEGEGRG